MSVPLEKILEAAAKAGFDSELKAVSMLSKAGWSVDQNVYYIDKDEQKGRELTVITLSSLPAYLKACTDWGAHMHSVMIENRDAFEPEGKP